MCCKQKMGSRENQGQTYIIHFTKKDKMAPGYYCPVKRTAVGDYPFSLL